MLYRSISSLALALTLLAIAAPALAQDDDEPRTDGDHTVSIEIQGRFGGGATWVEGDIQASLRHGGVGHLGASVAVRHFGRGLGAALAYSHVFIGIGDHYGTHAVDLRLSERFTLVRGRRAGRPVELSILGEVGPVLAFGGVTDGCFIGCSDHVDETVEVEVAGVVTALGLLFQWGLLLIGVEADYRHLIGTTGPVDHQDEVIGMARVGLVIDV